MGFNQMFRVYRKMSYLKHGGFVATAIHVGVLGKVLCQGMIGVKYPSCPCLADMGVALGGGNGHMAQ